MGTLRQSRSGHTISREIGTHEFAKGTHDVSDTADTLQGILMAGVERGDVVGCSAAVVNGDGVVVSAAAGHTISDGPAMTTDTVCGIASMTKALTGTAAMQLVEQGHIGLDQPAGEICPYLGGAPVYVGLDDNGEVMTRPAKNKITLRNLLTHTSGFVYDLWNAEFAAMVEALGKPPFTSRLKTALEVPLMFDPDTRWEYGIGIDWVGLMIEAVSGVTLGEYFAEHVTGPLGMHDTGFTPSADMSTRMAALHLRQADGSLLLPPPDAGNPLQVPAEAEFEMGGGGLLSTANDYARFLTMILRSGELEGIRILKPETVATMSRNQMGELRVRMLPTNAPALSNDAEFFPGEEKSWGLTFQINEHPASTGRSAGTLMWAGLTNCYYWIDPARDLAGVFITQVFPFADERCLDLYFEMETAAFAAQS